MMQKQFIVRAFWDDEAKVWVASSDNFVGIATEADTLDALIKKLDVMVPEILEANGYLQPQAQQIPYEFITERLAAVHHCH